ncbi:SDR family NAD(P)-dependent oxidoreductase [Desulfosporosinus sp. SB140]|uniref:SDR family NAD(P)-dependent oxidoreductase n=1 Tax=Desulfosporosinus paludis TaxID=3115649 RepID=UPI00388D4574
MELGLKDKVVVITGGATGIGKAAALSFAREGCKLAICGRSPKKLSLAELEFRQAGFPLLTKTADASKNDELVALAEAVDERYGQIDIWVNNAGIYPQKALMDMSESEWQDVMNINLKSVFLGSKIAFSYMKERKKGVILNAESFASLIPSAGSGAYAVSKVGISWLTKVLAAELAPYNIRVNGYIPGLIKTDITEGVIEGKEGWFSDQVALNRLGVPDDLAGGIVFLASDAASYITGTHLEISGGKLCVQNPHYSW